MCIVRSKSPFNPCQRSANLLSFHTALIWFYCCDFKTQEYLKLLAHYVFLACICLLKVMGDYHVRSPVQQMVYGLAGRSLEKALVRCQLAFRKSPSPQDYPAESAQETWTQERRREDEECGCQDDVNQTTGWSNLID